VEDIRQLAQLVIRADWDDLLASELELVRSELEKAKGDDVLIAQGKALLIRKFMRLRDKVEKAI